LDLRRVFGQSSCGHLGVEIAGALGEPAERHRRSQGSEWAGWCAGRGLGSSSPDGQGFTCRGLGSCSWVSILSSPAANCYMSSPTVTNRDSVKSRRRLRTEDIARCRASCSCNGWPGTAATVRRLPQLAATSETRWIGGHCNKAVAHCDDIGRPRDALPPYSASARGLHMPGSQPRRTGPDRVEPLLSVQSARCPDPSQGWCRRRRWVFPVTSMGRPGYRGRSRAVVSKLGSTSERSCE
jgi:hypothetical protein